MTALLALALIGLADEPGTVAEKVVEFARSREGMKVGDGQCSTLAYEALRSAGAKTPGRKGPPWGEELKSVKDAKPGDILQFEDSVFVRRRTRDDGAVLTLTFRYPHHTAVVASVKKRGKAVHMTVLHQNAGFDGDDEETRMTVKEWSFNPAEKTAGTLKAYRPVVEGPAKPS